MGKKIIKWDTEALHNFIKILDYIKEDSPFNAQKVRLRISEIINLLPSHPEMFKEDELKKGNDGTYRVFNRDRIRVSYKIEPDFIIISRIKHSSQEPVTY